MQQHHDRFENGAVRVRSVPITLAGILEIPDDPLGLVIFVHGSGSGRDSTRDAVISAALVERGVATLRFDLLSAHEAEVDQVSPQFRYDHSLLGGRVVDALDWVRGSPRAERWPLGVMGSSTGAAAAFIAAARRRDMVAAVVSRGGRVDLADQVLGQITAPTLLIVGGNDEVVLEHNRRAHEQLVAPVKRLALVEDAGHLFEEPGALQQVAEGAADWFVEHLAR